MSRQTKPALANKGELNAETQLWEGEGGALPASVVPGEKKGEWRQHMNIRPLYDRIVVKRIEEQETSRNGIIIPDSAKEKPQEGEVMAVGHGKRQEDGQLVALDVKIGDRILFGKYSGTETKLVGTEYLIMREDDVLGILTAANGAAK
jgi:chaperonin GroES